MSYKLNIGDSLPTFKGKDHTGHYFSSEDIMGGLIVMYFYPKDNTPGCTKEACSFRDHMDHFDAFDAIVIGVSPDNAQSHEAFIESHELNFTLLADESLDICRQFDVVKERQENGKNYPSIERTTFIIDSRGMIRWIERPVNVEGHTERVLHALQEISKQ